MWLESGTKILKQALSTFSISNIENSAQEQVVWLKILSRLERLIEWLAKIL